LVDASVLFADGGCADALKLFGGLGVRPTRVEANIASVVATALCAVRHWGLLAIRTPHRGMAISFI
jgi:hypothetical protein